MIILDPRPRHGIGHVISGETGKKLLAKRKLNKKNEEYLIKHIPPVIVESLEMMAWLTGVSYLKEKKNFKETCVFVLDGKKHKLKIEFRDYDCEDAMGCFSEINPKTITIYMRTILECSSGDKDVFLLLLKNTMMHEVIHFYQDIIKGDYFMAPRDITEYYTREEIYPCLRDEIIYFNNGLFTYEKNKKDFILMKDGFFDFIKKDIKLWRYCVKQFYKRTRE